MMWSVSEFILLFLSGQVESDAIKKIGHYTEFGVVSFGHVFSCELCYTLHSPVTRYMDCIAKNTGIIPA